VSEAELYELIAIHVGQIDAAFEFWLTISFGVLMAIHITGRSMNKPIKALLCTLYIAASLMSVLLTFGDFAQVWEFIELLDRDLPGTTVNTTAALIRMAVYVVGTAAISIAIFRYNYWVELNDT